jgi:hypothetical protein
MLVHRLFAVFVPVVLCGAEACKKDEPTGTGAAASASAKDEGASGKCTLVVDQPKCLSGGKAAFCDMSSKSGQMAVAWQTFTCPDCAVAGKRVKCSAFTVGEPCDMLATDSSSCSKDGKSEFTCDMATKAWKIVPCPGGCTGDMTTGLSCQ